MNQETLQHHLWYDRETGQFMWLNPTGRRVKTFSKAGSVKVSNTGKKTIRIYINKKPYRAHNLAWLYVYGEFPKFGIDHINGDSTDNRIENLRDVDHAENHKNRRKPVNNTSGLMGVCFVKARWIAQIGINNTVEYLGSFDNLFDAACRRKSEEAKLGFHEGHGNDRPL